MFLVMRMLAEMAAADPQALSFADHARAGLGPWAGFVCGWLYWYFWVVVVGIEAIAGAAILQTWIPLPVWQIGLVLMVLLTATNLLSTRSYGEFEFWFASIKVAAIVAFIVVAGSYALGFTSPTGSTLGNLVAHGGFAPFGAAAVLAGVTGIVFSLTGAEIVTVVAAESSEPSRAIAAMTTSLIAADPAVLRRLGVLHPRRRAVERDRAGLVAVRRGARAHRHSVRGDDHESSSCSWPCCRA